MDTHDNALNQILSDIRYCDEHKRSAQKEIEYYTREIDTVNRQIEELRRRLDKPTRELEYYRKELTDLDRKFSSLHQSEMRRRDELAREQQSKR